MIRTGEIVVMVLQEGNKIMSEKITIYRVSNSDYEQLYAEMCEMESQGYTAREFGFWNGAYYCDFVKYN